MRIRFQMALLALVACQSNPGIPGQPIGLFSFSATPVFNDCALTATPSIEDGGFTFQGTFSRDPASTQAFFLFGNVQRNAQFDGQILVSPATAPRHFIECVCDPVLVAETLSVALLSSSQDDALGHRCPPNPLDGGVPSPNPDAGILPPCPTPDGCNAVRACGELNDVVLIADAGCQCAGCSVRFMVDGQRTALR
jgi:hypothetical protein